MRIILTKHASYIKESLEIAKSLPEYFTKDALDSMVTDFNKYSLIVAEDGNLSGFLCFGLKQNRYEILWFGVKPDKQSQGLGKSMLDFLTNYLKEKKIKELYVKTLSPEDPYEPYKRTRKFYEENGFKHLYIEKATKKGYDDQVVMRLTL